MLEQYTIEQIVALREGAAGSLRQARGLMDEYDNELRKRMEAEGAQERTVGGYKLTYKQPTTTDKSRLQTLLEVIPEEELVALGAYTPEHQEPVAASWNMTKVKPLIRHSAEARHVIEGAQTLDPPVFKIEKT